MPDGIRWVGLDVHARESTFAIFDQGTGGLTIRRVVGPDDIAALAIHLMVNTAITGATYDIDGGQQLVDD